MISFPSQSWTYFSNALFCKFCLFLVSRVYWHQRVIYIPNVVLCFTCNIANKCYLYLSRSKWTASYATLQSRLYQWAWFHNTAANKTTERLNSQNTTLIVKRIEFLIRLVKFKKLKRTCFIIKPLIMGNYSNEETVFSCCA